MSDRRSNGYSFSATDAVREQIMLRAGFCGTTGSGKTYTALLLASRMVDAMGLGPVYVIDTEHKSALRYAYSARSKQGFRFKHVPMPEDDCSPAAYLAAVEYCEDQGAGVIVIDSLSHMWNGIGGVLEQVDRTTANSRSKNQFSEGWKEWTPIHARAIERVMQARVHVIITLRAKAEWVIQENDRGKKVPERVGLAPVAREGIDYEPDMFFTMWPQGRDTMLSVDKSRALDRPSLARGAQHKNPGDDFAAEVMAWLSDGEPAADPLDAEVDRAVAASTSRDAFVAARAMLIEWMREHRIPRERGDAAVQEHKNRVTASTSAAAGGAA